RARGILTGVVSNFDYRLIGILDGLGLLPLLDIVIRPADAGAAKPDSRIFHVALRRLDIGAPQALYVGDDEHHDVAAARSPGLRALQVQNLGSLKEVLGWIEGSKGKKHELTGAQQPN